MDVVQPCFSTRNVLKPNFHNCRRCAMLVDYCFSIGKIRYKVVFTVVVVQWRMCSRVLETGMCKIQFPQV